MAFEDFAVTRRRMLRAAAGPDESAPDQEIDSAVVLPRDRRREPPARRRPVEANEFMDNLSGHTASPRLRSNEQPPQLTLENAAHADDALLMVFGNKKPGLVRRVGCGKPTHVLVQLGIRKAAEFPQMIGKQAQDERRIRSSGRTQAWTIHGDQGLEGWACRLGTGGLLRILCVSRLASV
jgi:hypothetical protein